MPYLTRRESKSCEASRIHSNGASQDSDTSTTAHGLGQPMCTLQAPHLSDCKANQVHSKGVGRNSDAYTTAHGPIQPMCTLRAYCFSGYQVSYSSRQLLSRSALPKWNVSRSLQPCSSHIRKSISFGTIGFSSKSSSELEK